MQLFYETGFYHYGLQELYFSDRALVTPLLRKLYREGLIDNYEVASLTLATLKQPLTIMLYDFLGSVIVLYFELFNTWKKNLSHYLTLPK